MDSLSDGNLGARSPAHSPVVYCISSLNDPETQENAHYCGYITAGVQLCPLGIPPPCHL